mgnify:CR=1 FL=1
MTRIAMYVLLLCSVYAGLISSLATGDHWRSFAYAVVLAGILVVREDLTKEGAP